MSLHFTDERETKRKQNHDMTVICGESRHRERERESTMLERLFCCASKIHRRKENTTAKQKPKLYTKTDQAVKK